MDNAFRQKKIGNRNVDYIILIIRYSLIGYDARFV